VATSRPTELFLATADVVLDAVGDPAVGVAWREPSVLEDQTVGGRDPWPVDPGAMTLVLDGGVEIGRRRHGGTAMLRALYRAGYADRTLPVL
jgi:hypothetical protein